MIMMILIMITMHTIHTIHKHTIYQQFELRKGDELFSPLKLKRNKHLQQGVAHEQRVHLVERNFSVQFSRHGVNRVDKVSNLSVGEILVSTKETRVVQQLQQPETVVFGALGASIGKDLESELNPIFEVWKVQNETKTSENVLESIGWCFNERVRWMKMNENEVRSENYQERNNFETWNVQQSEEFQHQALVWVDSEKNWVMKNESEQNKNKSRSKEMKIESNRVKQSEKKPDSWMFVRIKTSWNCSFVILQFSSENLFLYTLMMFLRS